MRWFVKSRRAQNVNDYETWVEGGVSPTLNAFDNGNDTRATVLIFNIYGGNKRPDRPEGGFYVEQTEQSKTLDSSSGLNPSANQGGVLIFTAQRVGEPPRIYQDITPSLLSRMGTGGNNTPMIVDPTVTEPTIAFQPGTMVRLGGGVWEELAPTLRAEAKRGDNEPHIAREEPLVFDGYNQSADDSGIHRTLRIGIDSGDCIAMPTHDVVGSLQARGYKGPNHENARDGQLIPVTEAIVRRLTPTECERLMGWPDNHTLHRADGKTSSDSTRYKMCGNGVASPVARWIGEHLLPLLDDE